jgi:hypothetical protein
LGQALADAGCCFQFFTEKDLAEEIIKKEPENLQSKPIPQFARYS